MELETLVFDSKDDLAVVTLHRPQKLNAITTRMLDELDQVLDMIENGDARGLIITGAGRAFCAGSDIGGGEQHSGDTRTFAEERIRRMHRLILRLIDFRQPSIAALNGLAYGGGLEIALACTFRTAVIEARLCMPEIRHNLFPSYGGTQLLPRLIGAGRALQMMLTGESVDASTALQMGLVNAVTDDVVAGAIELLGRLPNGPGRAQRLVRHAVMHGQHLGLAEALELERGCAMEIAVSEEALRGATEFAQRKATK